MDQKDKLLAWKKFFANAKKNINELNKIEKLNDEIFWSPLNVKKSFIYGLQGMGYNKINKFTLINLIETFVKQIKEKENKFVISCSGSKTTIKLVDLILKWKNELVNFVIAEDDLWFDKKIISSIIKKSNINGGIYIQESILNPDIIEIYFYDKNGKLFNLNFLKELSLKTLENENYEITFDDKNKKFFLNNEEIQNVFSERFVQLFTNKIQTNKTKIAIVNNNKGITSIFAKIAGKLDYSYSIINPSSFSKKMIRTKNKFSSNETYKYIFWKEILKAKIKQANFLIAFNESGTRLFLFLLFNNEIFFLSENEVSLIFLHNFFNQLQLNHKKISNFFISSNYFLTNPMKKIVDKYDIKFLYSQIIAKHESEYLLFYWNCYLQFSFGETNNDEFSIYHICIKILEIVNYFNLQYNVAKPLIKNINNMYGISNLSKKFIDIKFEKLIEKIEWFLNENNQNEELNLVWKNNSIDFDSEQNLLYVINWNNSTIQIEYNFVLNCAYIILEINSKESFFNKNLITKKLKMKHVIKLLKLDSK